MSTKEKMDTNIHEDRTSMVDLHIVAADDDNDKRYEYAVRQDV